MNKINCPICSNKKITKFWAMPGYKLARCQRCNMVWDPFPLDDPLAQYQKNYFINDNPKGGYANYFEGMKINRKTFSARLKKITKKTGHKSHLLDVGSALGDCLLEAKSLGWTEIMGVEPSPYASKMSQERGLKTICGTIETNQLKPNNYKIITSQDVIEHVSDPVASLKRIYQLLKPGGWLFVVTPNISGTWAKFLKSKWYHYKPGEHINYFSPDTISQALKLSGFKNVTVNNTYHIMSLEYIINRCQFYFPSITNLFLKLIKNSKIKNTPFKVYSGELEAWAQKPKVKTN